MVLSENEALLIGCNCYSFLKIASIMLFIFNQKEIQLEKFWHLNIDLISQLGYYIIHKNLEHQGYIWLLTNLSAIIF
jgi:hypothetical protein